MSAPCTPTAGYVLFPGGDQTALPVQGAAECLSPFMTALPAHDAALRALHEDLNHGRDAGAQAEIDRYLVACAAEVGGLRAAPAVEALVLARAAVSVHDCLDLGVYVRQALVRSGTLGCAGVQKLVQYSIPFVKHNRLTFPPLADFGAADLAAMLQVMLVACMGLVPGATRRPTFRVRVLLVHAVHELVARGSPQDQHAFLARSAQVLRASLSEYLLFFAVAYMPTEMRLLLELHRVAHAAQVLQHMRVCFDGFRTQALQGATLDWERAAALAQLCNDKCNRVCKGKNRTAPPPPPPPRASSAAFVAAALALSPRAHVQLLKLAHPALPFATVLAARALHDAVRVFALPANLYAAQMRSVRALVSRDTLAAAQSTVLHLCLRCVAVRYVGDTNMRLDASGRVGCNRCGGDSVVRVSMLGRLLRVEGRFFAYCARCFCTHEWDCRAALQCRRRAARHAPLAPSRECVYCERMLNVTQFEVLDDELGVMHHVPLCRRHMPWQHRLQFVNTLADLAYEVSHKHSTLNPYTSKGF